MAEKPSSKGASRGFVVGVVVAAGVLVLALLAVLLLFLIPGALEKVGLARPTATSTVVESPSATVPAASATPVETLPPTASSTPRATPLPAADVEEQLAQAEALTLSSKIREAVAIYESLARAMPDDARPQTGWAWALLYDDEAVQALDHARRAAQLDPGSAEAAAVLARATLATGDTAEALTQAQQAVLLDPTNAEAHAALAEAYRADRQVSLGLRETDLALAQDADNANAHRARGWLYDEEDELQQAVSELQTAVGLEPKLWLRWHELGLMLLEAQNYRPAVDALEIALELRPKTETMTALDQARQALAQVEPTPTSTAKPTAVTASLGGRIAFPVWNAETGKYDTYVVQARDGSGRKLVVEGMHQPAFRPDGQWLAVNGDAPDRMHLFIVKADGSGLQEVTNYAEDGQPAWSPSAPGGAAGSSKLALGSNRHGDKRWRIYILDDIPYAGGTVDGRTLNYGPDDVRGQMPAWTSDGRIVYRGCDLDSPRGECLGLGLFIMSADPGPHQPTQLTEEPGDTAPAVNADRIAFMSDRNGNWEVYIMETDGTGVRRLTNGAANDGLPTWSPDGKTIAFVSDSGGAWAVWAMRPDGSNRHKLFDIGGGGLPSDWQHERISWGP